LKVDFYIPNKEELNKDDPSFMAAGRDIDFTV
jgi:hypothetical protein